MGYPDIVVGTEIGLIFLEVKTYNKKNVNTTQRSFYFLHRPIQRYI